MVERRIVTPKIWVRFPLTDQHNGCRVVFMDEIKAGDMVCFLHYGCDNKVYTRSFGWVKEIEDDSPWRPRDNTLFYKIEWFNWLGIDGAVQQNVDPRPSALQFRKQYLEYLKGL